MRTLWTAAVVTAVSILFLRGAAAQFHLLPGAGDAGKALLNKNYERSVTDYRQCMAENPNNANACEGLRHSVDVTGQAVGKPTSEQLEPSPGGKTE